MSPELAAARQTWYDNLKPGTLVRYNRWAEGYTNKPALVISVHNGGVYGGVKRRPLMHKQIIILVDENTKTVYQYLISPFDGWSSLGK